MLTVCSQCYKAGRTHYNYLQFTGGKQGCVAFATGTLAGLWDVLSCTNKEKYICKRMAEDLITTQAPVTTPAPNCSQEWFPIAHRDFCLKVYCRMTLVPDHEAVVGGIKN